MPSTKNQRTGRVSSKLQMQCLCSSDSVINTSAGCQHTQNSSSFAQCCQSSSRNLGNRVRDTKCKTQKAEVPAVHETASQHELELKQASSYLAAAEDIRQGHLNVEVLQNLQGLFSCLF